MTIHKELAAGRWFELSLVEQLANIGSDVVMETSALGSIFVLNGRFLSFKIL
jgi:hypothetical protein